MNTTKLYVHLTLVTFALLGCGDTSGSKLADFVKIEFKSSRIDLESKGFLCKEEEIQKKTKLVCKSYEKDIDLLGRLVTKRSVLFDEQGRVVSIAAELHPKYASFKENVALDIDLSGVYTKATDLKELKMDNDSVKNWRRPDGTIVRLSTTILGMPGLIDDSVHIVAFSKGIGEEGWKK